MTILAIAHRAASVKNMDAGLSILTLFLFASLARAAILGAPAAQPDPSAKNWLYADLRRIAAPEARQGAAADGEFLYVISNHALGKYRKETGGPRVGNARGASRSFTSMRASCMKAGSTVRTPITPVCPTSAPSRSGIRRRSSMSAVEASVGRTVLSPG